MAYTAIDDPEAYFQAKIFAGTGGTQSITFDGDTDMQPDLIWIKSRADTNPHSVVDSVRGATKMLWTNVTAGEGTFTDEITAFGSDGFTLGASSNAYMNESGENQVAWCWKESATAGFDILLYTGNATNRTISHSLSAVPEVVIVKRRDDTTAWSSLHLTNASATTLDNTDRMVLNDDAGPEDDATMWQDTDPTSSVFTLGTSSSTNVNTGTYVAYLWAPKQGFSKFGSFDVASGDADGPFCYCGFRPAWVMLKSLVDGANWVIADNKRTPYNPCNDFLKPNTNDSVLAPTNKGVGWDLLSNGFKIRNYNGDFNDTSYDPYIWMAFAESPFVNSNGVPNNAR